MEDTPYLARKILQGRDQLLFQGGDGVEVHGGAVRRKTGRYSNPSIAQGTAGRRTDEAAPDYWRPGPEGLGVSCDD
ncbi:hypothetical protein D3C86_1868030 [compost metagenome]